MVQSDSDFNKVKFPQSLILCYDTYFSHSITKGKHVMQKLNIHLHRIVDDIQLYLSKKICIRSSMESRRGVSPWRLGFVFFTWLLDLRTENYLGTVPD